MPLDCIKATWYSAEDSVRIIGTTPPISSHVSPIIQNIVIPKKIALVRKYLIIIGNITDNTFPCIINRNLTYTTSVKSIVMKEEFNKLLPKMIMIGTKGGSNGMICSGIPEPEKQKKTHYFIGK